MPYTNLVELDRRDDDRWLLRCRFVDEAKGEVTITASLQSTGQPTPQQVEQRCAQIGHEMLAELTDRLSRAAGDSSP